MVSAKASLEQKLSAVTSAHSDATTKLAQTETALGKFEAENAELKQQHSQLTSSHATLSTTLADLQSSSDKRIGGLMKEVNEAHGELRDSRNSAQTAAKKREEAMALLQSRLDAANNKIVDLNELLGNAREGGRKQTDGLSQELAQVKRDLQDRSRELQEKTALCDKTSASLSNAEAEMEQMKSSMLKMSETITESRNKEEDTRAALKVSERREEGGGRREGEREGGVGRREWLTGKTE
jgi:chromosome segregation ATPase